MSPSRLYSWIAVAGLLLVQGCTLLPSERRDEEVKGPALSGTPSERHLPTLLRFYQEIGDWPEKQLEAEGRALQPSLTEGSCTLERVKLGLMTLRAVERGIKLDPTVEDMLRPCMTDARVAGSGIQALTMLINTQVRESIASQQRLRVSAQELDVTKKENQELRRQLEGLKAIERSLQDRRRR